VAVAAGTCSVLLKSPLSGAIPVRRHALPLWGPIYAKKRRRQRFGSKKIDRLNPHEAELPNIRDAAASKFYAGSLSFTLNLIFTLR